MSLHTDAPTQVQRVTFTREAGYMLCLLDFSNIRDVEGAVASIRAAAREIAGHPPRSLRVLTDVMGSRMSLPLIAALQHMVRSLHRIVSEVRQGADTISAAAREVAQGNADLSARTEAQASALQQTASAMEQLTAAVRMSADNADQANASAALGSPS